MSRGWNFWRPQCVYKGMSYLYINDCSKEGDWTSEVLNLARAVPETWKELPPHILLRLLRLRLGMTQDQLARLSGLSRTQIVMIEKGRDVLLGTLRRVFAGLGCRLVLLADCSLAIGDLQQRAARLAAEGRIPARRRG